MSVLTASVFKYMVVSTASKSELDEAMQAFAKTTTFQRPRTIKETSSFLIKFVNDIWFIVCLLVCGDTFF